MVEKRRESSDFVVDDGYFTSCFVTDFDSENLGYFDDGEEHLGVQDDASDGIDKISGIMLIYFIVKKRTLDSLTDSKAYKKARRLGSNNTSSVGDTERSQSATILNFIRPGQSTTSMMKSASHNIPGL